MLVTWNKLKEEDGAEYLQSYSVVVTIEMRGSNGNVQKRQTNEKRRTFNVDKTRNMFQYNNIEPFMSYTFQVNAELLVNGEQRIVPITQPNTVVSAEAGKIFVYVKIEDDCIDNIKIFLMF